MALEIESNSRILMDRPSPNPIGVGSDDEAFNKLLCRLEPEYPSVDAKFSHFRHKLIKFFAWRRCEDPDGLADEAIGRLVKNIHAGREVHAENAYSYVYAITVNLFREYLREKKRNQQAFNDIQPPHVIVADTVRDCRKICLQSLSENNVALLEKYYADEKSREDLARMQGTSLNALRLQVHRIKNVLRGCYKKCLKGQGT